MDRFLIRTGIGYPPENIEKAIIKAAASGMKSGTCR
jgi:MoxR-like ATPase